MTSRRLLFAPVHDLELWRCRPIGAVKVLDLKDREVGHIEGLILDAQEDRPLFLVVGRPGERFLVAVGDAWFDETERAIRIDPGPETREGAAFDPDEFSRMSAAAANAYERKLLAGCCPEIGFHHDGTPDYAKLARFQCPSFLRPSSSEAANPRSTGSNRARPTR